MFQIEQEKAQDFGPRNCCGSKNRLVAGLVYRDGNAHAAYQVHWTPGQIERHGAVFLIILGLWGEGTVAADRHTVALRYRADSEATGFMVVGADETRIASHPLAGRALRREEVVGTPLAKDVFDIVDFIWLHDERISEITHARMA
jgi:hypothetical protein